MMNRTEAPTVVFPTDWDPGMIAGWLLTNVPPKSSLVIPVAWRNAVHPDAWYRVFGAMPEIMFHHPHVGGVESASSERIVLHLKHAQEATNE